MKSKLEIIKETVKYYSKDPKGRRSKSGLTKCMYNGPNGTHCAVGRYLMKKYKDLSSDFCWNSDTIEDLAGNLDLETIDEILVKSVRGHELVFWQGLQNFHDNDYYWDAKTNDISASGHDYVSSLMNEYS